MDTNELKKAAEAATVGIWRYGPGDGDDENPIIFVDLPQASGVAISVLFESDWATDADAKFVSLASPAAVLELIAENKRLKLVEEVWKLQRHIPAAMVEMLDEHEKLESELEALRKAALEVLSWTEAAHRPPVADQLEVGRSALVRLHALAGLHAALNKEPDNGQAT